MREYKDFEVTLQVTHLIKYLVSARTPEQAGEVAEEALEDDLESFHADVLSTEVIVDEALSMENRSDGTGFFE